MDFSTFTRTISGNIILFVTDTPLENVGSIRFYKDNAAGNFVKKEFRWSFTGDHWAS